MQNEHDEQRTEAETTMEIRVQEEETKHQTLNILAGLDESIYPSPDKQERGIVP